MQSESETEFWFCSEPVDNSVQSPASGVQNTAPIVQNTASRMRVFMWQMETQIFTSSYIWLAYIFEASYGMVVTSVSKKSSVDQSELEK